MTLRGLVASGLVAAATAAPALADGAKAPVLVSTEVVRSCRVTSEQAQVSVQCGGTQGQPVQVSYARAPQSDIAATGQTSATASPTSVTIQF